MVQSRLNFLKSNKTGKNKPIAIKLFKSNFLDYSLNSNILILNSFNYSLKLVNFKELIFFKKKINQIFFLKKINYLRKNKSIQKINIFYF